MRFGIHAGPQDCTIDDLRRLWRTADQRGFHWCSVWDHLFSVSDLSNPAKPAFEGVATMAALASETRRVRVGCLVFCVCYRSPGVLAKAAVTIDHLSDGRCELGIGSGWNEMEARAFGLHFGSVGARLDLLEETATVLRRLFDGERVTFEGRQVRLQDALCDPFLAPELFARRNATLEQWCERERRDPRAIVRTVNLGLAVGEDEGEVARQEENLRLMFGPMTDLVRPGILVGTPDRVIDRVREYAAAGAEWVILALRAPFDWKGLELFIREVMPAFPAA
jgi:alkanesulfonate monooxygenase SsuD/methylene tetrahydromethanopterin reductase-like flavin-dependent oxidoreductase (luciferase family)